MSNETYHDSMLAHVQKDTDGYALSPHDLAAWVDVPKSWLWKDDRWEQVVQERNFLAVVVQTDADAQRLFDRYDARGYAVRQVTGPWGPIFPVGWCIMAATYAALQGEVESPIPVKHLLMVKNNDWPSVESARAHFRPQNVHGSVKW